MSENELWLPVVGYESNYEVSNTGQVRTLRTGLVRKTRLDKDGYVIVDLCLNSKYATKRVHRLVAEAFLGVSTLPEIDHLDGNRSNNHVDNLRWVSVSVNRTNTARRRAGLVRGVRYRQGKPTPWQAYANFEGKFLNLGHFEDESSARAARSFYEMEAA